MINPNFVILGAVITLAGGLVYLIDTIKEKVKPNRVSWFLWFLAPLIAFIAEIKQGVGILSLMTFVAAFEPLVVFIATFVNKKSAWKISRFDIVCGAFSVIGLILWYITKIPNTAIVLSIIADFLASVPTVTKSYSYPETENIWPYISTLIGAGITMLTIDAWSFANYSFPAYLFLINTILCVLIQFKVGKIVASRRK
ncbi:MAG TPA: hypothetical protein VMB24_03310 [Dehalococcoidales bacterium]|nr:hypothetical protein [Dehalococcoidales bacterium]